MIIIILEELTNESLKKILNCCYAYTSDNCWGTDDCYYCAIILFINEEKRRMIGFFGPYEILDRGKKTCKFFSCTHCRAQWSIHYLL